MRKLNAMNSMNEKKAGKRQRIVHEVKVYLYNALYLALFFAVFTNYRRLILADYRIVYTDYGISIIKALILAKVVLVAEDLRLGQRFEEEALIVPTLYKSIVFALCEAIFTMAETLIRGLIQGHGLMGAISEVMGRFTYEGYAGALVVFFAFIPFFAIKELSRVLGEGKLMSLFFRRGQTEDAKLITPERQREERVTHDERT